MPEEETMKKKIVERLQAEAVRNVVLRVNTDARCGWPGGGFAPEGPLLAVGDYRRLDARPGRNPVADRLAGGLAARLFVGFNVGGTPTWTMDDLLPIIEQVRVRQTGDPNATFLFTRGLWRSERSGRIEREEGAQVVVLDERSRSESDFEAEMVELAEEVARRFRQEYVYVEMQKAGIPQVVLKVVP
jgi:hypothetical protein